MTPRRFRLVALLAVPLILSACGDGWEMVRTDTILPYGNQRTAGTGVAWVRKKMLPERDLKLQDAAPVVAPAQAPAVAAPPPPEDKMEKIFTKKQEK